MANLPENISIANDSLIIDGKATSLEDTLRAETSEVEDLFRTGVLLTIGLFAPIIIMIVIVLADGSRGLAMWFGPVTLILTCACGVAAAAIGLAWPKPWGVLVDRGTWGFRRILRAPNRETAEAVTSAINDHVKAEEKV